MIFKSAKDTIIVAVLEQYAKQFPNSGKYKLCISNYISWLEGIIEKHNDTEKMVKEYWSDDYKWNNYNHILDDTKAVLDEHFEVC